MKEPSFQYYPKDWRADPVFSCSLAARGLWHEMMNMMHASERYGYLSQDGQPIADDAIARYCGCSLSEYLTLLEELYHALVPRRTPNGIIFSRRMVMDAARRADWRKRQKKHRIDVRHRSVTAMSRSSPSSSPYANQNIKSKAKAAPPEPLPDWVPAQEWKDFCEMRQRIRAPMIEAAKRRILADLSRLRDSGSDPKEVLGRSIERSWRGVFAVPNENGNRQVMPSEAKLTPEQEMKEEKWRQGILTKIAVAERSSKP